MERYKAILGYVPEEPHLYTYLTGPEYLRLIGRLRGVPDATLDDKIDRFLQLLGINRSVRASSSSRMDSLSATTRSPTCGRRSSCPRWTPSSRRWSRKRTSSSVRAT